MSDLDREYFHDHALILAQHPSESVARMMVRCLAFILNASENLTFTAGLSTPDEPDLRESSLDGRMLRWIDVGEPGFDRIKKACRQAQLVKVYSFNTKSDVWWRQNSAELGALNAEFYQFTWQDVQNFASVVGRSMDFSASISDGAIYVATNDSNFELPYTQLHQ